MSYSPETMKPADCATQAPSFLLTVSRGPAGRPGVGAGPAGRVTRSYSPDYLNLLLKRQGRMWKPVSGQARDAVFSYRVSERCPTPPALGNWGG